MEFDQQQDKLWGSRHRLEEWQKVLWVHNQAENNVSAFLHHKLLRAYLVACGYELMDSELSVGEATQAHVEATDYHEIPDASEPQYAALHAAVQRGQASAEDKLIYLKAKFRWDVVPRADQLGDLAQQMFQAFARNQLGIERRILNHRVEKQVVGSALNVFADNVAEKAETVRGLCQQLGILDTCAVGSQIERAVMEKSCEQVLQMKANLKETFDLRLRESGGKRNTLKRGLEVLNQVFHKHGFTEIVADGGRKRLQTGGRRVDTGAYTVREQSAFLGFARHAVP